LANSERPHPEHFPGAGVSHFEPGTTPNQEAEMTKGFFSGSMSIPGGRIVIEDGHITNFFTTENDSAHKQKQLEAAAMANNQRIVETLKQINQITPPVTPYDGHTRKAATESVQNTGMSRDTVFAILGGERQYQKRRWGRRVKNPPQTVTVHEGLAWSEQAGGDTFVEAKHEVATFLTFMRHYLAKAEAAASEESGNAGALTMLRKVLALGVSCAEQHGLPVRESGPVANGHDGLPS
jgi:hypothetical protein